MSRVSRIPSLVLAVVMVSLVVASGGCSSWFQPASCDDAGQQDVQEAADWLRNADPGVADLGAVSDCDSGGSFVWTFSTLRPPSEFLGDLDPVVCEKDGMRAADCRLSGDRLEFRIVVDVQFPQEDEWHIEVKLPGE